MLGSPPPPPGLAVSTESPGTAVDEAARLPPLSPPRGLTWDENAVWPETGGLSWCWSGWPGGGPRALLARFSAVLQAASRKRKNRVFSLISVFIASGGSLTPKK